MSPGTRQIFGDAAGTLLLVALWGIAGYLVGGRPLGLFGMLVGYWHASEFHGRRMLEAEVLRLKREISRIESLRAERESLARDSREKECSRLERRLELHHKRIEACEDRTGAPRWWTYHDDSP